MPKTQITTANRTLTQTERFPAFKFQNKGEKARLALLDIQVDPATGRHVLAPWFDWVHRLEKPEEKDGQPVKKKITKKDRDGNETETLVWATEWVGNPICLGDDSILRDKGADPANCPVCLAVSQHPEAAANNGFGPPIVRYAMNVVRYSTRPGSYVVSDPFSAQIVVLAFTDKRFNRLDDLNNKVAERGAFPGSNPERPVAISDVDILLECEEPNWQRYSIDTAEGWSVRLQSQAAYDYIQALWTGEGQRATDEQLQLACGRPVQNRAYLDEDIRKVADGWRKALNGAPAAQTTDIMGMSFGGAQSSVQAGMGALMTELGQPAANGAVPQAAGPVPATPAPSAAPLTGPVPATAPVSVPATQPAPLANPQAAPVSQPVPASPAPSALPQQAVAVPAPPQPVTPAQALAAAGPPGLGQFAAPAQQASQPSALQQAAAPELAALAAQQMAALQQAGVPGALLPGAVPATAPAPPQAAPQAPADLFAAPAPGAAPAGPSPDFAALTNFGQDQPPAAG